MTLDDLRPGTAVRVELDGEPICVARRPDGEVRAVHDTCSHEEFSLAEGWISGEGVECALHGSVFDLDTGRPTQPARRPPDPDLRVRGARRRGLGRRRPADQRRAGPPALRSAPTMSTLEIVDLKVSVEDTPILDGLTLTVKAGETHALMGPNGSGKSTLAYAVAGHPAYTVTGGQVLVDGADVTALRPDERAKLGLFLAMQYPTEIPGVSLTNFLRTAVNATREAGRPRARSSCSSSRPSMAELEMDESFLSRNVNEGFSGGEKKRFEILQMALLKPRLAILDETDSGLDIDALRIVAEGVNKLRGPDLGVLLITHYTRILRYITPDHVHVMVDGRIVASGGPELAEQLEAEGYERFRPAAA